MKHETMMKRSTKEAAKYRSEKGKIQAAAFALFSFFKALEELEMEFWNARSFWIIASSLGARRQSLPAASTGTAHIHRS